MSLLGFLLLVIVVGVLVTLVVRLIPDQYFAPQFKTFLVIAAVVILALVLLVAILGGSGWDVQIPRAR
jgi:hypothetical protein